MKKSIFDKRVSTKEYNRRYKNRMGSIYGNFGKKTFDNQNKTIETTEEKGVIGWIIKWLLKP